jgi:hypothetical protein
MMMTSTIIRQKSDKFYGKSTGVRLVKQADTVEATVRSIGRGFITVGHVLWAINMQLDETEHLTAAQVRRSLNELAQRWPSFSSRGHGVYVWL